MTSLRIWMTMVGLCVMTSACGGGGGGGNGGGGTGNTPAANAIPTASAGTDQQAEEGAVVVLDGSASADPEGAALTYTWSQVGGPAVALSDTGRSQPQFIAPDIPPGDPDLVLVFELVVSDGSARSTADAVEITVPNANEPPVADAGADQTVAEGSTVTLIGMASSDPEQAPLSYQWAQTGGPAVTLSDATAVDPEFQAPAAGISETLTFELAVSDGTLDASADTVTVMVHPPTRVAFDDTLAGVVPNNHGFTGSTDRTLNIPGYEDSLNLLDGYSTISAARVDFDGRLDPGSIAAGDNVRVSQVTLDPDTRHVLSIVGELEPGVDYLAEISNLPETVGSSVPAHRRVLVKPLLPFEASTGTGVATGYLVVVTNGLRDEHGLAVRTTDTYDAVRGSAVLTGPDAPLEELRQQTVQWTELLDAYPAAPALDVDDIVASFSFTTQSTSDALLAVAAAATSRPLFDLQLDAAQSNQSTDVNVYSGTIQVPGYRATSGLRVWVNGSGNRVNRYDPVPVQQSLSNLDFYAALPKGAECSKPAAGWPVVLFVTGGTGSGNDHLALIAQFGGTSSHGIGTVADELGAECLASISMQRVPSTGAVPEQADAYRQVVADLIELVHTLPDMELDGDGQPDFAADSIGFIGLSSGASQGLVLMAVEPAIGFGTFGSPDVGIAKSLDGSPLRSPGLEANLEANFNAPKGSATYESIVGIIQTGYDAFDPLNYLHLIRPTQAVHLIEIYGGGVLPGDIGTGVGSGYTDGQGNFLNPGDITTPPEVLNTGYAGQIGQVVETAPLAGMEAAARVLGLASATATVDNRSADQPVRAIVRFARGHHSSGYFDVFQGFGTLGVSTEWRNQQTRFMASRGRYLPINSAPEASVLQSDPTQ